MRVYEIPRNMLGRLVLNNSLKHRDSKTSLEKKIYIQFLKQFWFLRTLDKAELFFSVMHCKWY